MLKLPACKLLKDDTKQKYLPDVGEKYCFIPLYATVMALALIQIRTRRLQPRQRECW